MIFNLTDIVVNLQLTITEIAYWEFKLIELQISLSPNLRALSESNQYLFWYEAKIRNS